MLEEVGYKGRYGCVPLGREDPRPVVNGVVDGYCDVFHRLTCFHCAPGLGNYLQCVTNKSESF